MQDFHISDARMRGLGARLSRTRAVVWTVIAVERLWPLFLPIAVIISLFLSLSWLGVFRLLPDWGRFALLGVLALGLLASLVPFRKFRLPSSPDVDRRIETANRLEHAPLLGQGRDEAGALQRGPGLVGQRREQGQFVGAELVHLRAVAVQGADDLVLDDERHGDDRPVAVAARQAAPGRA